jgi:hypothetical protein
MAVTTAAGVLRSWAAVGGMGRVRVQVWLESRQFRGHFHYAAFGAQLSNWRS